MKRSSWSIKTQLIAAFAAILVLMVAAIAIEWRGMLNLNKVVSGTIHGDVALAQVAAEMHDDVLQLRRYEKDVFINISTPDKVASYRAKWQKALEELRNDLVTARATATSADSTELRAFAAAIDAYSVGFEHTYQLIQAASVKTTQQANDEMGKFKDAVHHTEEHADAITASAIERSKQIDGILASEQSKLGINLMILTTTALLLAGSLAMIITRRITIPLHSAVTLAQSVASGHLGHRVAIARNDELGQLMQALQEMDGKLCEIISEVRFAANTVSTTTKEIAQGNDHLSSCVQEQALSLEQTAASIEEMTAAVKHNADNAIQATNLARNASNVAENGGNIVTQAVAAMTEITTSSHQIANIIGVIDEIAFQTNLLALNAAVEAARAGEQGRGFAVVATEVRNLAQRSAAAAKEIKTLINNSVDKVQVGSDLVAQSGRSLTEIVDSTKRVTGVVAEIAAANSQQSAGIDQINNAVMQLDETTKQNAAVVEQVSAASQAMQEQAEALARKVAHFTFVNEAPSSAIQQSFNEQHTVIADDDIQTQAA